MIAPSRLRRLAVVAAALGVLAFGACGSDEPSGSAADVQPSEAKGDVKDDKKADAPAATAKAGDSVEIVEFQYKPANLKAAVGAPVTWTNKDEAPHTVTANDKSFDSGDMAKGATFKHTFDKPGTYKYFCAIHNYMTGEVTVA